MDKYLLKFKDRITGDIIKIDKDNVIDIKDLIPAHIKPYTAPLYEITYEELVEVPDNNANMYNFTPSNQPIFGNHIEKVFTTKETSLYELVEE